MIRVDQRREPLEEKGPLESIVTESGCRTAFIYLSCAEFSAGSAAEPFSLERPLDWPSLFDLLESSRLRPAGDETGVNHPMAAERLPVLRD